MSDAPAMGDFLGADAPTNWGKWGPDDELGCAGTLAVLPNSASSASSINAKVLRLRSLPPAKRNNRANRSAGATAAAAASDSR